MAVPYVLAHEIAHIIEGSDRHSDSGVMKAEWDLSAASPSLSPI
jgi:hypothetical protein